MKRITVYRNPYCEKCRKFARMHQTFDWLHRVEMSTETPPTGPLQMGEIVVEDHKTGDIIRGVDAVRRIAREIPIYAPFRLLLRIPAVARYVDKDVRGCADGSCELPSSMSRSTSGKQA